jgi:hypothetical protein
MSVSSWILVFVSFCTFNVSSNGECVGIHIKKTDFDMSVDKINVLYSDNKMSAKDDFILSVRIYNTLVMNYMTDSDDRYKIFYDFFSRQYLEKTLTELDASLSRGMAFYSKKYNIYIGGKRDANSMFCLE